MSSAADKSSFAQRSAGAISSPVPGFTIPALPDKIARIDPEGARQWQVNFQNVVDDWVKKQNSVAAQVDAAIAG